ncbi:MAG: ribosome biogenesis GTPase Der [Planctomycetaceae bacterium]|nr:ribosome biogenesis GTPase Der [Planctomycetota bacterium]NUN52215.1 ribosome biogenesis GTPase Der [Planctomycetaceae bacterium]
MPLPLVAIVGRPNVGKSTLFNALLGRRVSIVDPTAGTTRDRVAALLRQGTKVVEIMDTGGIGLVDESRLEDHINAQVDIAIEAASIIVFVLDVRDGITPLDTRVADRLRRQERPVILAANKADGRALEHEVHEFQRLGLGEPVPLSALHRFNTREIRDRIMAMAPEAPPTPADDAPRIAIVGRRNAGKSTFLNALCGTGRVITADLPGTTRDAVDVRVSRKGREYVFIDTAGVVKKTKVDQSVEFYAQVRTVEAVERCDVALLLLDITEEISQTDKKVAALVVDAKKPLVIVGNKWDLSRSTSEKFEEYFRRTLPNLAFAPVSFASALEGRHLWETVDLALEVLAQSRTRIETAEVNRVFRRALEERTPRVGRTKVPKIYYATQVSVHPPSFVLFVNDPKLFPSTYRRFLENRLRAEFPFGEVPLRLTFRAKERAEAGGGRGRR